MTIIKREGKGTSRWKRPITSLEDWRDYAGPKDVGAQWWPGFSALECAHAWLEVPEQVPAEIITLLGTHAAFGTIATWEAEPEVQLRFDKHRGPRNTDLLVEAVDEHGALDLAVEAKVRESFGETVEGALATAKRRLEGLRSSKGVLRIQELCRDYMGAAPIDEDVKTLRYQLLTATAGAVQHALRRRVRRTVLLIHEFAWGDEGHSTYKANAADLNAFVARLTRGTVSKIPHRQLIEVPLPVGIAAETLLRFFVGKTSRSVAPPAPAHTRRPSTT